RYLPKALLDSKTVLLAALVDGEVVGYAYGELVGRDYFALLDACGKLHDIYVDARARGKGVGEALVRAMQDELRRRGAPRMVLLTATQNEGAQRLFAKLGFRTTMLEMTAELEPSP
ncbi:MAG: GNAT family N-acetyltransferase, partial [Myxococcales bacterium]|nr:GNAT family N-acetyltransferase [Myxococcales bacterium]